MPVQYLAGAHVNATGACVTKTDILNLAETQLVLAGWSVISGSGTANRLFQTGTTPQGLATRVRFKDNGGTCVQVSIESTDGTLVGLNNSTNGGNLQPGMTYRVVAAPCYVRFYSSAGGPNRVTVYVEVPYIPSPVAVPSRAAFMICDSVSDVSTAFKNSWRTSLVSCDNGLPTCNTQVIWAGNLWQLGNQNATNFECIPHLVLNLAVSGAGGACPSGQTRTRRWRDGSDITSDALLAFGITGTSDEPMLSAQMWDTLVIQNNFAIDAPLAYDGHNWICGTSNNVGAIGLAGTNGAYQPRGGLFFVTP